LLWWTDYSLEKTQNHEGVGIGQPPARLDDSNPTGIIEEPFDFEDFIVFDPLTTQVHESYVPFLPGISPSTDGALAENSQSQSSLKNFEIDAGIQLLPSDPAGFSSSSSVSWPAESVISLDDDQASQEAPDGKREIPLARKFFVCPTCTEAFSNESLYRRHRRHRNCSAQSANFVCDACQRSFHLVKDLKRHQGLRGSAPVCPMLKAEAKQFKRFVCTCDKASYTRKDSLQRHITDKNAIEGGQQHQCKSCHRPRCCC
jgi:uncharacterized Zn-finger protein